VKRYVRETGSSVVWRLLRSHPAAASRLSEVEVASALARLRRDGLITEAQRAQALERLTDDFRAFWVIELVPDVVGLARVILRRHSLRAADAIQLASCLHIRRELSEMVPLVVFDDRLAAAAVEENISVVPRGPKPR
jgi:uncharacterized protein